MQTRTRAKAAVGYGMYRAAKPIVRRAVRRKTGGLIAARGGGSRWARPLAAGVGALAAIGGVALFWRRRPSAGG